jgi:hypothetical protein
MIISSENRESIALWSDGMALSSLILAISVFASKRAQRTSFDILASMAFWYGSTPLVSWILAALTSDSIQY